MMAKMSETDVIIQSDIKRYKKNSSASWLVYLAIVFLVLYFLILYANSVGSRNETFVENILNDDGSYTQVSQKVLGSNSVYSYIFGVDVILNLAVLLFGFYTAVKLGGYSKTYSYIAYVLAAVQVARIFMIPFCYLDQTTTGTVMLEAYDFTWLVVMLVLSAVCFIGGGLIGYSGAVKKEKFQNELNNGTIDLEAALKDENDVLSKDESSLDILGEDLDSGKVGADDTSDEALLEAETTSVGGE